MSWSDGGGVLRTGGGGWAKNDIREVSISWRHATIVVVECATSAKEDSTAVRRFSKEETWPSNLSTVAANM